MPQLNTWVSGSDGNVYADPTSGTASGVFTVFNMKTITDDDGEDDGTDIGFSGDLDFAYSINTHDTDTNQAKAWVWIASDSDRSAGSFASDLSSLQSHSSYVGPILIDRR